MGIKSHSPEAYGEGAPQGEVSSYYQGTEKGVQEEHMTYPESYRSSESAWLCTLCL